MRENILNNKYFICFSKDGNLIEYAGRIVGEAADGWFYAEILSEGLAVTARLVVPVAELGTVRFYNSESAMVEMRRSFGKPLLRRTNES